MLPLLLLPLIATAGQAPTDTAKADEAIHKYLVAETTKLSERFMDGARTKDVWEERRPRLKQEFLDMMGLWPLPGKTDLKATVTGSLDKGNVVVEKLHYQSRPGLYVTANLYRPISVGKKPAILYVCGHTNKGRDGNKTAFQDHGLWFATNGYVCLVVDTLQLGEIAGTHHGTYREGRWWWQSRGYTPAGVECWNGIRGIDYLISRPDVDPEKIGVTGISGGGATTCWIAAADDRVKVAVPVSGMSDLESYVSNKVINGHCDCMFFYNTYRWEWTTVLALFAPKPLLFANSDNDSIFPMDGNRRIIARLRTCYDMLGAKGNVDDYVSKGGHDYRPDLRIAVFSFFNKHLKAWSPPVKDADFPKIDGKDLRVFPEDKDLPKDAINATVDETFVPKAEVKLPEKKEDFAAWKAALVERLRETSFRSLPRQATESKVVRTEYLRGLESLKYVDYETEPGIACPQLIHVWPNRPSGKDLMVIANYDDERHVYLNDSVRGERNSGLVLALYPRGSGPTLWTRNNPPNTVERSLILLGRTVDSGRVRDATSWMAYWRPLKADKRMAGRGPAGVIAATATLLDTCAAEVVLLDPPTDFRKGPYFPSCERVVDLPTLLGLLAPDVKLTLTGKNAKDKAFDKTAEMYKLAGAADKFKRE